MARAWGAFAPLLLLMSSMPSPYHYCVLMFAAVVGADALVRLGKNRAALMFLALYVLACVPVSVSILTGRLLLTRLFATFSLYVFFLFSVGVKPPLHAQFRWMAAAFTMAILLFISSFTSTRGRAEDFRHRLTYSSTGYSASHPVTIKTNVVFTEMLNDSYGAMVLDGSRAQVIPAQGDVLAVTGGPQSSLLYFEQVGRQSSIVRSSIEKFPSAAQPMAEGESPTVSANGKWIAYTRRNGETNSVWLVSTDSSTVPQAIVQTFDNLMDVSVSPSGDLVAAAGPVSNPHLVAIDHATGIITPLHGILGPARYPALSPDGRQLAFSHRKPGSWQLVVRDLMQQRNLELTNAPCNATLPAWENNRTLLYATDCGRGLGLTALTRIQLKGQ